MTDTALENLRTAIVKAASGDFALDAAFLTKGLNNESVVVPDDYDANIKAAFKLASAADFMVSIDAVNVGPITDGAFEVTKASVPFIGIVKTPAMLLFTTTSVGGGSGNEPGGPGDSATLVVQVETSPADWTWNTSFPFAIGWPFNQLDVVNASFAFSTADGFYPWGDDEGMTVTGGPTQSLAAQLPFPEVATPFLGLFSGLGNPPTALDLAGSLNLSELDSDSATLPSGTLDASIKTGTFDLFYLRVSAPRLRLAITSPSKDDEDGSGQSANLLIAADIGVGTIADYQIEVTVERPTEKPTLVVADPAVAKLLAAAPDLAGFNGPLAATDTATSFTLSLAATKSGALTPQAIIELAAGSSYFSATPAVLQQFLASVGLQGFALAGQIGKQVTLTSIAVRIGSEPGKDINWTPIPVVPAGLNFTIQSFSLDWSILQTMDAKALAGPASTRGGFAQEQLYRQQNFVFATSFNLAPNIFKGKTPGTDGLFEVEFTSGLRFTASFDGTAKLSDFLATLTGNAVSLESVAEAELSNIRLSIDFNAKSFSFTSGFGIELPFLKIGEKPVLSISDGQVSVVPGPPPGSRRSPWSSRPRRSSICTRGYRPSMPSPARCGPARSWAWSPSARSAPMRQCPMTAPSRPRSGSSRRHWHSRSTSTS